MLERLAGCLVFAGAIRAVLLVENLGAWRDLCPAPGWLLAHVPGWDTAIVGYMLDRIEGVPVVARCPVLGRAPVPRTISNESATTVQGVWK